MAARLPVDGHPLGRVVGDGGLLLRGCLRYWLDRFELARNFPAERAPRRPADDDDDDDDDDATSAGAAARPRPLDFAASAVAPPSSALAAPVPRTSSVLSGATLGRVADVRCTFPGPRDRGPPRCEGRPPAARRHGTLVAALGDAPHGRGVAGLFERLGRYGENVVAFGFAQLPPALEESAFRGPRCGALPVRAAFARNVRFDCEQRRPDDALRHLPIGVKFPGVLAELAARPRARGVPAQNGGLFLCCCMETTGQRAHRAQVYDVLRRNGLDCEGGVRPLEETAALYRAHDFVVDIHGANPQDYRVWEILALRAVPVLLRLPDQDELFAGLPVVRVEAWADVTPALLEAARARLRAEGNLAKAHLPYWLHELTRHFEVPPDAPATKVALAAAVAVAVVAVAARARAARATTKVV